MTTPPHEDQPNIIWREDLIHDTCRPQPKDSTVPIHPNRTICTLTRSSTYSTHVAMKQPRRLMDIERVRRNKYQAPKEERDQTNRHDNRPSANIKTASTQLTKDSGRTERPFIGPQLFIGSTVQAPRSFDHQVQGLLQPSPLIPYTRLRIESSSQNLERQEYQNPSPLTNRLPSRHRQYLPSSNLPKTKLTDHQQHRSSPSFHCSRSLHLTTIIITAASSALPTQSQPALPNSTLPSNPNPPAIRQIISQQKIISSRLDHHSSKIKPPQLHQIEMTAQPSYPEPRRRLETLNHKN